MLAALPASAGIVSVIDGHHTSLSWVGAVRGHRVTPLGVNRFGQSGDVPDLYANYGISRQAIVDACDAQLERRV